ncbi:MAG: hypothetical protein GY705_23875, partial [Bacteroidetes bacterium]|nr:hypothetical protein [Bacteroidota bacterium]
MLSKEMLLGRIAGPFDQLPQDLIVSPLAAVPKKEVGKIRIIHNLSFPLNDSVNSNIPRDFCFVEYELIDTCIQIVANLGRHCLMSKCDLCSAFRLLRCSVLDLHFLGFRWKEKFFFDLVLPMGLSISCSKFEKLSCALQWICLNKLNVKHMSHILDDFLFFGPQNSRDCELAQKSFLALADSVGLAIKEEKTVLPSTQVELHGILFNSDSMTVSLPPDKVIKAKLLLKQVEKSKSITLLKLQQIHGFLNFAVRAIPQGRCFLRRISDLLS